MAQTSHGWHVPGTRTLEDYHGGRREACGGPNECEQCFKESYSEGREPPTGLSKAVG